ncbi:hypothetical protein BB560_003780 [Smittium megazygosporum]|uniref:ATP-dependent RNA helicase DED1 n=1 Tax=Smittium megazygosporum TaxID=133381 RepID=A0A2T9ZB55_9FUNG|nr:hypothetical protein BB560_003780 [Smittium megazygosporum]
MSTTDQSQKSLHNDLANLSLKDSNRPNGSNNTQDGAAAPKARPKGKYIPPYLRGKPTFASQTSDDSLVDDPAESPNFPPRAANYSQTRDKSFPASRPDNLDPNYRGAGPRDNFPQSRFNSQNDNPAFNRNTTWSGRNDTRFNRPQRNNFLGMWAKGKHFPGQRNPKYEFTLFGPPDGVEHTGINFDKYDDIPVEASGPNVPPPITNFEDASLNSLLAENISLSGFLTPTPVQKWSIPICSAQRDLMACAQTGSGKTGGFLFPILNFAFDIGPPDDRENENVPGISLRQKIAMPIALILSPTRELATQIYDEARKYCYRSWVRPCVVYGGADINQQIIGAKRGCDLLVATPGRLVDMIQRGVISLKYIQFLVLDEADRMLDMGFEPQIRRIVEQEDMPGVHLRQTLMFSATFPKNIQILARDFLKEYVFLSVGRVGSTSENITQKIEYVEEEDKFSALIDILNSQPDQGLTLIFVETKKMADILHSHLISQSFQCCSIHGGRTQSEREYALESFKNGRAPVMVATAVAARGLDIPNVTHVINFDLPSDIDDYVHRIGRTGRAGNVGIATSFFNRGNRNIVRGLVGILKDANQEIPSWLNIVLRESYDFGYSKTAPRGRGRGGYGGGSSRDYRENTKGAKFNHRSKSTANVRSGADQYGNRGSNPGANSSYGYGGAPPMYGPDSGSSWF